MKKLLALTVALSAALGLWQIGPNSKPVSASAVSYENPTSEPSTGSITAHKFNDVNENGVQDAGEEDIKGWLFRLYAFNDVLELVGEGRTDSAGDITFTDLPANRYKVWEKLTECWAPTIPGGNYWDGGYYFAGYLNEGQQKTVNFGNVYTCSPLPEACIDLEKTGPETAYPGDTINYHFKVHNCSTHPAGGIHVYDLLFGEAAIWTGALDPDQVYEFDMEYTLPGDLCDDLTANTEFVNDAWAIWYSQYHPKARDDDSWTIEVICGPEPNPSITIEKSTNDQDADEEPGPEIPIGDTVTWEYIVTNTGNVALTDIVVTDDVLGEICTIASLAVDESQDCTASGTAETGQYENIGTVVGYYDDVIVSDDDPSHYFGYSEASPAITIEKSTNGEDADVAPGPYILAGSTVNWEYVVTNTGNVALTDIVVTDDVLDEICTIASLAVDESQDCTASGTAETGQYENIGTVVGHYGVVIVSDDDASHYFGVAPAIDIEKFISIDDQATWLDTPPVPDVTMGDDIYFKLVVTNTGNAPLTDIALSDPGYDVSGCAVTDPLPVDGSFECIIGPFAAEEGLHTNTATVTSDYSDDYSEERYEDSDQASYLGVESGGAGDMYYIYLPIVALESAEAGKYYIYLPLVFPPPPWLPDTGEM